MSDSLPMTERVTALLEFLHASGSAPDDDRTQRNQIRHLLRELDAMIDVHSLEALARKFHKLDPVPTPHVDECNTLLASTDPKRVSTILLLGLVRTTFSYQSLLPAWRPLADRMTEEIKKRRPKEWRELLTGIV